MTIRRELLSACLAAAIGLPSAAYASDDWREIQVSENSLVYTNQDLQVRGTWQALAEYRLPRMPKINATVIECVKSSMTCVESAAQVATLPNRRADASPYLNAYTFEYAVESWDAQSLVARRINPRGFPVNETLTISIVKGIVRKQWKDKPKPDGYFEPADQGFEILVKTPYRM